MTTGHPSQPHKRSAATGGGESPQHAPRFFATAARGTEAVLAAELRRLELPDVRQGHGGVAFGGGIGDSYRACLWSRAAARVLLRLAVFPATSAEELYAGAFGIDWNDHLRAEGTLACDATGTSAGITDTRYAAQVVKDAVVDRLRERHGQRPSVDIHRPDLRLNLHIERGIGTLSIDLAGESLHRRGYRQPGKQIEAPLKENLAAAILLAAGWPRLAESGAALVDPLCGSGTFLIEGGLIAADIAPGLLRGTWGFSGWLGHDAAAWTALLQEAKERRAAGLARLAQRGRLAGINFLGFDHNARAVRLAQDCLRRADLQQVVRVELGELDGLTLPKGLATADGTPGLVATNPPYGERLDDPRPTQLYQVLGRTLRKQFPGWRAAVLVADRRLTAQLDLPVRHELALFNGPLKCTLLQLAVPGVAARRISQPAAPSRWAPAPVSPAAKTTPADTGPAESGDSAVLPEAAAKPLALHVEEFANRLRRNLRVIGRPLRRDGIVCYRLYDADLPDYNLSVDLYEGWAHVQEYAAPAEVDPTKAAARLTAAIAAVQETLELPPERVILKVRRRQRGAAQYDRMADEGRFVTVHEHDAAFLVNLTDYLDTGLFLDQRLTRGLLRELAPRCAFLNLFGYTGAATVCAALGGAHHSTTVDLSATYLAWARRNFDLNGLDPNRHRTVQADCLVWLAEQAQGGANYDLVYLAPPTFSNSKRMGAANLDIQRDHVELIRTTLRLLHTNGVLIFESNRQGFHLDRDALGDVGLTDLSRATLAPDCARRANAHHVWRIEPALKPSPPPRA